MIKGGARGLLLDGFNVHSLWPAAPPRMKDRGSETRGLGPASLAR